MHKNEQGVFHDGELAVQRATGERVLAERHSRMIQRAVPPGPAAFLAQQRMLVLASVDAIGTPCASLVCGAEGFASTSDGETVALDRGRMQVPRGDGLLRNLRPGAALAILAIELDSRRRYRINGFVSSSSEDRIELRVSEAYGNCPKYIQRRRLVEHAAAPRAAPASACGTLLDPERRALVQRADTMFVASTHPARGADASHRGGEAGFLQVRDERTIRVPEYAGNGLYNTLGNLFVSSRAGLAIVDFECGRVLQLGGATSLVLGAPATGSYWDFVVSHWTELSLPSTSRWELVERSPFNPPL